MPTLSKALEDLLDQFSDDRLRRLPRSYPAAISKLKVCPPPLRWPPRIPLVLSRIVYFNWTPLIEATLEATALLVSPRLTARTTAEKVSGLDLHQTQLAQLELSRTVGFNAVSVQSLQVEVKHFLGMLQLLLVERLTRLRRVRDLDWSRAIRQNLLEALRRPLAKSLATT